MKKIGGFFLVLVLLLPIVNAEIHLDDFSRVVFNYGDSFVVSGFVKADTDQRAYLDLSLVCGAEESPLFVRLMDISAGVENTFSKLITVPSSAEGNCKILARLNSLDGNLIEGAESKSFSVSGELKGAFDGLKGVYQLGEKGTFKGAITKLDGSPFEGFASLYFMKEGAKVFVENKNIINGDLDVSIDLSRIPPGSYSLDVEVSDSAGNKHLFEDVTNFEVIGGLNVDLSVADRVYDPSEDVRLVGTIRSSVAQSVLEGLELVVKMGDEKITRKVSGSNFDVSFRVPEKIKSGVYSMSVSVRDAQGNYGERVLDVQVGSVPKRINLEMQRTEFEPNEKVGFTAFLYDQADELMTADIVLKVFDPGKQERASQSISTNRKTTFDLPAAASPGGWEIEVSGIEDLRAVTPFLVKELKKLDVQLENGKFLVKNIGNVVYDEPLKLIAGDKEFSQNVYLEPNQVGEIELIDLFSEGVYDILVPDVNKEFKNVNVVDERSLSEKAGAALSGVTGQAGKTIGKEEDGFGVGLIMGLIVIFGLLIGGYFAYKRGLQVSTTKYSDKEFEDKPGVDYHWTKNSGGIAKKEKVVPKRKFEFGKATAADVEDFKKRMVKTIEDEEIKRKDSAKRKWLEERKFVPSSNESSGSRFGGSVEKEDKDEKSSSGLSSLFK